MMVEPLAPPEAQNTPMKQSRFPPGWDEARVSRVLSRYESQSEEQAVAEDQAALELIAKYKKV